jgi:hypothetical protein
VNCFRFFMNFVSSCVRYVYEMLACTRYVSREKTVRLHYECRDDNGSGGSKTQPVKK